MTECNIWGRERQKSANFSFGTKIFEINLEFAGLTSDFPRYMWHQCSANILDKNFGSPVTSLTRFAILNKVSYGGVGGQPHNSETKINWASGEARFSHFSWFIAMINFRPPLGPYSSFRRPIKISIEWSPIGNKVKPSMKAP